MKEIIFLTLIFIFTLFRDFWRLNSVPPLLNSVSLPARFLSAGLGFLNPFLLYVYILKSFKSKKTALLSTLIFVLLPQSIAESRITSPVNSLLFLTFLFLNISLRFKVKLQKVILFIIFLFLAPFLYPKFWLFQNPVLPPFSSVVGNFADLVSFDTLFFQNNSFYWGGVRTFGMLYLALLPFFLAGVYLLIKKGERFIFLLIFSVFLLISVSPFFPEERLTYLLIPFFSLICAVGLRLFWLKKSLLLKTAAFFLLFFTLYQTMQFFHYYLVHFPLEIHGNIQNYNFPF